MMLLTLWARLHRKKAKYYSLAPRLRRKKLFVNKRGVAICLMLTMKKLLLLKRIVLVFLLLVLLILITVLKELNMLFRAMMTHFVRLVYMLAQRQIVF